MNIFERIASYNLPYGKYAVFGSALLEVFGIRKAQDIDIIITPDLYEELKMNGEWEEKQANGFSMLIRGEACLTTTQTVPTDGTYCPDRLKLIADAVPLQGIPFVRLEEVIECKISYDRPKDRDDLEKIEEYLRELKGMNLYPE